MSLYPPMSEREKEGAAISRYAASQGMVLLKNENHVLPLQKGKIALFGNGAIRTVRGGTGSGDPFNGGLSGGGDEFVDFSPRYHIQILDAAEAEQFEIVNKDQLTAYGKKYDEEKKRFGNRVMESFAYPEEVLDEQRLTKYAEETETAILVISRNSGEGKDRCLREEVVIEGEKQEIGNYCLSHTEKENLKKLRHAFKKLILVLNVAGPVAVEDFADAGADSILLMGQAGQEGGAALMDILTGRVNPSGKLSATWALKYEDYPSSEVFLKDPDTALYEEGIYVGYRYFDTFDVTPGFAFGFGLSYTNFSMGEAEAVLDGDILQVSVPVVNTGNVNGREVVQIYVSAPTSEMDMPAQELKGFRKTKDLKPGETEKVEISVPLASLASFSEEKSCYLLSEGMYQVAVGNSSRNVKPVCQIKIQETVPTELVYVELPLQQNLNERKSTSREAEQKPDAVWNGVPVLVPEKLPELLDSRSGYHDQSVTTYTTDPGYQPVMPYESVVYTEKNPWTFEDVRDKKVSKEEFLAQFSAAALADFCCGTGWGVADAEHPVIGASSESVPGAAGETTHKLEEYGVPSIVLADGPGGVRVTQEFEATDLETGEKRTVYHYCTAWPVGTLLAQSFDPEVMWAVGRGMAADMKAMGITLLLGPGMNIQRDPMCGRNFEYFSEDPFLTGKMGAAISRGIESVPNCGACIKHFAANNQETNRQKVDSVIGQRALREIYLEPFKIAIKEAHPLSIMTSYNLINGVPTADSYDLCTDFARGECGFDGLIMTDWNGGSSTPFKSMHAGNDLIMPGGEMRARNILKAVEVVEPEFDERGQIDMTPEAPFLPIGDARWNSFIPDEKGQETVVAELGEGHTAEVKNGYILVDGEPVYTRAQELSVLMRDREKASLRIAPAEVSAVSVREDGKAIMYRGTYQSEKTICLGDIQRCAGNILDVIMRTR